MERVVQHLRRLQVGVVIIASSEGGTWRTRHLRLRAAKLRDVLEAEPWVERCHDTPKWNLRHMPGQYLVADGLTKPLSRPRIPKLVDATITINVEETPKVLKAHSGYTIQREVEGWKVVVQASGLGNFAGSVERATGKIKGSIDSGSGSSEEKAEEKEPLPRVVPWEDQGMMHLGRHALRPPHDVARDQARHLYKHTCRDSL